MKQWIYIIVTEKEDPRKVLIMDNRYFNHETLFGLTEYRPGGTIQQAADFLAETFDVNVTRCDIVKYLDLDRVVFENEIATSYKENAKINASFVCLTTEMNDIISDIITSRKPKDMRFIDIRPLKNHRIDEGTKFYIDMIERCFK